MAAWSGGSFDANKARYEVVIVGSPTKVTASDSAQVTVSGRYPRGLLVKTAGTVTLVGVDGTKVDLGSLSAGAVIYCTYIGVAATAEDNSTSVTGAILMLP
jgi:hypothetical protein